MSTCIYILTLFISSLFGLTSRTDSVRSRSQSGYPNRKVHTLSTPTTTATATSQAYCILSEGKDPGVGTRVVRVPERAHSFSPATESLWGITELLEERKQ